jgi:hypothetical protein
MRFNDSPVYGYSWLEILVQFNVPASNDTAGPEVAEDNQTLQSAQRFNVVGMQLVQVNRF